MKFFAIFFCMVIGYPCVDLPRFEGGKDDNFKANRNARKAASNEFNKDQYSRSKDVHPPAQTSDGSFGKHSSAVTSERKLSRQMFYCGKLLRDFWSLLKHLHRNFPNASDEIGYFDTDYEYGYTDTGHEYGYYYTGYAYGYYDTDYGFETTGFSQTDAEQVAERSGHDEGVNGGDDDDDDGGGGDDYYDGGWGGEDEYD